MYLQLVMGFFFAFWFNASLVMPSGMCTEYYHTLHNNGAWAVLWAYVCRCEHVCACARAYVRVCVCFKQSHYPQQHNELVSHISSGKSPDNYTGLSLRLSLPLSPALILPFFSLLFLLFTFFFFQAFSTITKHSSSSPYFHLSIIHQSSSLIPFAASPKTHIPHLKQNQLTLWNY